jgi:hypothetical protein
MSDGMMWLLIGLIGGFGLGLVFTSSLVLWMHKLDNAN